MKNSWMKNLLLNTNTAEQLCITHLPSLMPVIDYSPSSTA